MIERILLIACLLVLLTGKQNASAQTDVRIRLGVPDLSDFPTVRLTVQTADSRSVPLSDLSGVSLRENGVPVGNVDVQPVPVGMDVIFVIDSNDTILLDDDGSGQTRLQNVQESISRFANRFMSPRDRVSMIVPDEVNPENGRLLLDAATQPDEVVAAITSYNPQPHPTTPLNRMMISTLAQAQRLQTVNRFQAILLFSDAGQLPEQLNYAGLIAQAESQQVAIFSAILGGGVTTAEIENVTRLANPTRGDTVHMPAADATDPFYLVWQRQANQSQISYQSMLTESGRFPLTVNIGAAGAATELELNLLPPAVSLQLENEVLRRVGTAVDTPLADLAPVVQPLPVTVTWPDGIVRTPEDVTLLVNGMPQFLPELPQPDASGSFVLAWDVQNSDTGAYELVVQVADRYGLVGETTPQLVTIVTEWPSPPAPTPVPTSAPTPSPTSPLQTIPRENLLLGGLAIGLAVIILLFLGWLRRNRTILEPPTPSPRPRRKTAVSPPPPDDPQPLGPHVALLELLDRELLAEAELTFTADSTAIGRDEAANQLVLNDKTVAPLHARIRRRNGRYWLYDEGSASGTFLNHERLGLAPRQLQDGDLIKIGRLNLRFRIKGEVRKVGSEESGKRLK